MSLTALEECIPSGDRLLLDASTLVAYLNGDERVSPVAAHIIDGWVRQGRNRALVSAVSVMEVLVRPLRLGVPEPYWTTVDFLTGFPNLAVVDLTMPIAQEAAGLRAQFGFSPPDALTIATGIASQVSWLITNDSKWKGLAPIAQRVKVCYLEAYLPFP